MMHTDELLTLDHVSHLTKSSTWTIRGWIRSGKLQAIRVGRSIRIRQSALDAFIETSTAASEARRADKAVA